MSRLALTPADPLAVAIAHLGDALDVPVHNKVPADRPDTFVTVVATGGDEATQVSDTPTVLVQCWALDIADAMTLARTAVAHLRAMRGQVIDDVTVYRVAITSLPAEFYDPESKQPRVVFTAQPHLRGAVAVGS